ncbi:MAG: hypothetical protein PWP64_786 [Candidatus Cloacimonadota bacterium]|nr:hypothetical protein [Candidatus Cloacimonadota bacterium]
MIKITQYQAVDRSALMPMIKAFRKELALLKNRALELSDEDAAQELADFLRAGFKLQLAFYNNACAGFLAMHTMDEVWWVDTLFVKPEFRRKGIAKALIEKAEQELAEAGPDSLFFWVHPNNAPMLSFLKSCGYDVLNLVEVRKAWKNEKFSRAYHFDEQSLNY